MFNIICLLLFLFINHTNSFYLKQKTNNYCYATDVNPYKYFATKTAYEIVHGNNIYELKSCDPLQFWSINRHGTRYPKKKEIKRLKNLTELKNQILNNYKNEVLNTKIGGLCEEDVELFKNWYWDEAVNKNVASFLTSQGWKDLKQIAERNKKKFPKLLEIPYPYEDFLFRFTRTERTNSSFKAYVDGLFDGAEENINAVSYENDTLIRTYKNCKYWEETVDQNPKTFEEYYKFLNTTPFLQLISDVSIRLGFKQNLDSQTIQNMFSMCRYQQAWFLDKKSNWCAAFTKNQLEILEYAEDLMYYYAIGHGIPLNKKVGCMPLKDMMKRFRNIIHGIKEPKSVHYFTHSSAIQLLMAAMDMNKDSVPLKADNMADQKNRLWRTSLIGPFATNINAVLYKCGDAYQVAFYLNEKLYDFQGCSHGICSWDVVEELFGNVAKECNLDFCQNDDDDVQIKKMNYEKLYE